MTRNIENRGEEGKEEEVAVGGAEGKCCHSVIYLGSVKLKRMSVLLLRSLTNIAEVLHGSLTRFDSPT